MTQGPDRLNFGVLSLLGLLLVSAGGYGLARGYGVLGKSPAAQPVLGEPLRRFVGRNGGWLWPLVAAASLMVAWLGLRWLRAQIQPPGVSRMRLRSEAAGSTEVRASGAAGALARDIEDYPEVHWARAWLVSDGARPEVEVIAEVIDDTNVSALRRRIDEHAFVRFRQALDLAELSPRVHLRLTQHPRRLYQGW